MHQPMPRIELGIQLRNVASAALDISDGLLGDLRHILKQSQVDAQIHLDQLPKSSILKKQESSIQNLFAACGGDDYELCFTAPSSQQKKIQEIGKSLNLPLTLIGKILPKKDDQARVYLIDASGALLSGLQAASFLNSFDHFA